MVARVAWLAAALVLVVVMSGSARVAARPLLFAHRGDHTVAPENTIAAIRAATAWADGVEFDVHLAPDGSWRLSHDELPPDWRSLPQLPEAVAAAGHLLLDIDLKEASNSAHRRLAEWIAAAGIADRTTVNVKSIQGARIVSAIAPATTVEGQPDWIADAFAAEELDIVAVWGEDWRTVLESRDPGEVALFVNSIAEPGLDRWAEAVAAGVARYYADGPPEDAPT